MVNKDEVIRAVEGHLDAFRKAEDPTWWPYASRLSLYLESLRGIENEVTICHELAELYMYTLKILINTRGRDGVRQRAIEILDTVAKRTVDEIIRMLKEGKAQKVRVSWSAVACLPGCLGYHKKVYVAYREGKFYEIVSGEHHAYVYPWIREREITEEEARKWIEVGMVNKVLKLD